MKTDKKLLKSLKLVKVERDKNATSTKKLHLEVEIETLLENFKIAKFSSSDIENIETKGNDPLNIVRLFVHLIPKGELVLVGKTVNLINGKLEIDKAKDAKFEFDDNKNSILVIEANVKGAKPDGAKRKVITYDDCDEIDEGIG